jgi:hypothetical protein
VVVRTLPPSDFDAGWTLWVVAKEFVEYRHGRFVQIAIDHDQRRTAQPVPLFDRRHQALVIHAGYGNNARHIDAFGRDIGTELALRAGVGTGTVVGLTIRFAIGQTGKGIERKEAWLGS